MLRTSHGKSMATGPYNRRSLELKIDSADEGSTWKSYSAANVSKALDGATRT